MTAIVREHNLLTGHRFVVVEYLLVSLLLGALGGYYLLAARWIDAAVWLGIVANCLAIAALAVAALRSGAADYGSLPMRRREFRAEIGRQHPHLALRTTALVIVTFVPFVLVLLVVADPRRAEGQPAGLTVRGQGHEEARPRSLRRTPPATASVARQLGLSRVDAGAVSQHQAISDS